MRLAVDHGAQPRIGVSRIHQHDMGTLLIVLAHDMVHEERLSAARRPQHELVAVGDDALLHGQVTDVVQGLPRQPVHHLDAEGRERTAVVRFLDEEASCLLDEGIETFLGREVRLIAGDACPVECRAVHRVVPRHALHACQLASDVVLGSFQFLAVVAPRNDVIVGTDADETAGMRFVQVFFNPLAVDGITA